MAHPAALGKYRITEVLGEGAMGVVYKAFDPDIQRVVALKTIRRALDDSDGDGSMAARFRNEAQAAGRLQHPGIVGVYDYGRDQQVAYIAMEFVEGRSLAAHLTDKLRFTDDDIPGILSQLLDALGHAHDMGVWHRDIKPANIILTRGGRLKVADFGIARIEAAGLTQTAVMIGTPSHMAPEQFLGHPIDRRVDIYGAGVVLYQLLTGRPPFSGSTESLMYRVVHEAVQPPSAVDGANRPHWYDAIVARALAKRPDERFADAAEFKQAIVKAVGDGFDASAWEKTLLRAPVRATPPIAPILPIAPQGAPVGIAQGAPTAASQATHWDPTQLAQAETSLAHHLGPLAAVLVRRAARECHDLPALYARLAEQVTNPSARSAFLGEATLLAIGGAPGSSSTRTAVARGAPAAAGRSGTGTGTRTGLGTGRDTDAGFNEAVLQQAQDLLAQHLGPIAKVVVRRAAACTDRRDALFASLGDAVSDPTARAKLLARLAGLV